MTLPGLFAEYAKGYMTHYGYTREAILNLPESGKGGNKTKAADCWGSIAPCCTEK